MATLNFVECKRREVKDGCLRCQRCLDAASLRQKRYREKKKAAKAGLGCIPSTTTPIGPGPATMPPLSLDAGVSAEAQPDIEVQYLLLLRERTQEKWKRRRRGTCTFRAYLILLG